VVVGRYAWQREIIETADRLSLGEVTAPVARPAGLGLASATRGRCGVRSLTAFFLAPYNAARLTMSKRLAPIVRPAGAALCAVLRQGVLARGAP
jgi:hypothetical protein